MKTRIFFWAILLLLSALLISFLPGCTVYNDITSTADSTAAFDKYKTFAWLPDECDTIASPYNNHVIRNNLRNYFGQEFTARGYRVELDTPDVLLQIVIVNKKQEETLRAPHYSFYYYRPYYYCSRYYFPYSYDYYYHGYSTYCYDNCYETIRYVEGSITLNMIDRRKKSLVWTCTAKGNIYDPAFIDRDIHPAVLRIMKKFPVVPVQQKKIFDEEEITRH